MGKKTLDHLLEIEAEASIIVNETQREADWRLSENNEKNRINFETRCKTEIKIRQARLEEDKAAVLNQYQKALDDYRKEISVINPDNEKFCVLLNSYLSLG